MFPLVLALASLAPFAVLRVLAGEPEAPSVLAFSASTATVPSSLKDNPAFQKEVVEVSTRSITVEYRLSRIAPRTSKSKFRTRADSKRTTLKKAIEEDRQWELYALEGLTTKELWREMVDPQDGRGPINNKTGERMAALTDLNCRWKADFARARNQWRIANVYLSIQHTIVFPEATRTLLAEDQQSWDKFTKALSLHELGHVEINRKHLQRFVILSHKITASSPDELEQVAQSTFEGILGDLNEENERYDKETNHGETQGAVLTWVH